MSRKGFASTQIILVALGIVLVGGGIWYYSKQTAPPSAQLSSDAQNSTADWKTYRNEKYGFEFKHPDSVLAGAYSVNSSLGSYTNPRGGIYVGPFVFVVVEDQETRDVLKKRFSRPLGETEGHNDESDMWSKDLLFKIPSDNADITVVKHQGEGGNAFDALVRGSKYDVFVDGYSEGYNWSAAKEQGSFVVGSNWSRDNFSKTEGIERLLSTFKFINQ